MGTPQEVTQHFNTHIQKLQIENNRNSFSIYITRKASKRETLVISSNHQTFYLSSSYGSISVTQAQNNTWRDQIFCLDLAEVKDEMLPENNNSVGSTEK